MAALAPDFWAVETQRYLLDFNDENPGSQVVLDIVKSILLSVSTVILAGKSVSILNLLRQKRRQGEKRSAGVYAVTGLVLSLLFAIGAILYCTKLLLALKKAMCANATWDSPTGPGTSDIIHCSAMVGNGYIHDKVDRVLLLVIPLNAQIILSIANGILVYRCCKVFSDMRVVYIPVKVIYLFWVVFSFIEMYLLLLDWPVPVHPRLFQLTRDEFMHLCWILLFILNLFVTVAIATRRLLHLRGKSSIPEGGSFPLDSEKKVGYNKAMILLVDAALPVTVCSFTILVAYAKSRQHNFSKPAFAAEGILGVFWLTFSVMAPQLIAIHNLRAEAKQYARRFTTADIEKLRDSSLDMTVKTLTYSGINSAGANEVKV